MIIRHMLLCRPSYFRVDYEINPWMQIGSVDLSQAQQQWEALFQAYQAAGITVSVIDQQPDVPDMVFAADQGILLEPGLFLVSNFHYPERQRETQYYKSWWLEHGYRLKTISQLDTYFEGNGDCLFWKKDTYLMGVGYRNSTQTSAVLTKLTGQQFLPLQLVDARFYHLDTCLCVLDEQTALYYPAAFAPESIILLQSSFPRLVGVPQAEAENFALNSVVSEKKILIQQGNPQTRKISRQLGYLPIELDISEFMKSGGGIHCLGQVLELS